MKLIVEDDKELYGATVVESIDKNDGMFHPLRFKGLYSIADCATANKRVYPYKILKEQYDRYKNEDVSQKRSFGAIEHPTKSNLTELEEHETSAIFITSVEEDVANKSWSGEAILMQSDPIKNIRGNKYADIVATMVAYSDNKKNLFGFSTRGYGDLSEPDSKGIRKLSSWFLKCIDLVSQPANKCYAEGIFESKEFMLDMHGRIVECAYNEAESLINSSTKTFDLDKKREIYRAAWDTLLKKI